MIIYVLSADVGDCSDRVTVTLNGLADVPPLNSRVINTNPIISDPVYWLEVNLTTISTGI